MFATGLEILQVLGTLILAWRPPVAGGIVLTTPENPQHSEVYLVRDGENWGLPKGKIEYGETPEAAAFREVKEEIGIDTEEIDPFFVGRFPRPKGVGYFYLMGQKNPNQKPKRQEEEIDEVKTFSWKQAIRKVEPYQKPILIKAYRLVCSTSNI